MLTSAFLLTTMQSDPDQMHNLADSLSSLPSSSPIARLHSRLDALLLVLKTCAGESCRLPWKAMFSNGKVQNLKDAMKKECDAYFRSLPDVRYSVSRRFSSPIYRASSAPTWD
jgi:N-acetylglucosamine-6-sulfatase